MSVIIIQGIQTMIRQKQNKILKFFIAFITTNTTIFLILQEYVTISAYLQTDFNYQIIGPYMAKSSLGLSPRNCHQFYNQQQTFVSYFLWKKTHNQYMAIIKQLTLHHGQLIEVNLTIVVVIIALIIQIISFAYENSILEIVDIILTLTLPHFTLMMNAIDWGETCIGNSPVLDVFNYTILSYAGQFTFGSVCFLILLYSILEVTKLLKLWWCCLIFSVFVSFQIIYIIALNIATLMMNNSLETYLFLWKIALLIIKPRL